MEESNLLDHIFGTSDEQVETFMDHMQDVIQGHDSEMRPSRPDIERMKSGKPDGVSYPNFVEQLSGFVLISHGWDGEDYVWHMSPARPNRSWKVPIPRVLYAVVKTMNEVIPQNVIVDIFPPYIEWDIKEITFKAHGLNYVWQVGKEDIHRLNLRLFEVLNTLL